MLIPVSNPHLSYYASANILNHLLRSASISTSSIYLALYHTDISGKLNSLDFPIWESKYEISASCNYTRIPVSGSFTVTSGCAYNTWNILSASATSDWGYIRYMGIKTGSQVGANSGVFLFSGSVSDSNNVNINTGERFIIPAQKLQFSLTYAQDLWVQGLPYGYTQGWSTYSSQKILNHYLNNIVHPATGSMVYLALYNTLPTPAGLGGTEVSGVGYSRVKISASGWADPIPLTWTSGCAVTYNTESMIFTTSAGNSWGMIDGICIMDAPTGGNIIFRGLVYPRKTYILEEDGFYYPPGRLRIYPDFAFPKIEKS